ncbi:MAG TPA: hypothetical protein VN637_02635 [Roseiarcus sp.]|nr:hypothetical protein [Roseiarcus sp.]
MDASFAPALLVVSVLVVGVLHTVVPDHWAPTAAGLQRVRLGPLERYGEAISGAFIALVGVVFCAWPVI